MLKCQVQKGHIFGHVYESESSITRCLRKRFLRGLSRVMKNISQELALFQLGHTGSPRELLYKRVIFT